MRKPPIRQTYRITITHVILFQFDNQTILKNLHLYIEYKVSKGLLFYNKDNYLNIAKPCNRQLLLLIHIIQSNANSFTKCMEFSYHSICAICMIFRRMEFLILLKQDSWKYIYFLFF